MKDLTWAEREVKIACEKGTPNKRDGEFDLWRACCESALKAYNSIIENGHGGVSVNVTKNILNKLIEGKPITPIEDTEDVWQFSHEGSSHDGTYKVYQCKRMSSLFKDVYLDGTVKYSDLSRFVYKNVDSETRYHSDLIDHIMYELHPIKMPYYPVGQFLVTCEEFLSDQNNGDFDTFGILFCTNPYGKYEDIDLYFKKHERDFVDINKEEYMKRKAISEKLKKGDRND